MISATDLQFDKMEVDTKSAQEYLKKYNHEFRGTFDADTDAHHVFDAANNKIYCSDTIPLVSWEKIDSKVDLTLSFYKLAKKIQENMKLFCELEFLIRGRAIQYTQIELHMIMSYLRYLGNEYTEHNFLQGPLTMENDSPLIDIGCLNFVAQTCHLLAAENTAAVCHLFVELCRSSGFDSVKLSVMKNEDIEFLGIPKAKVLDGGCIGVVMTESDVESAVDVLLSAPKGDLWGIRRILVQESACERFNTECAWRTRAAPRAELDPRLAPLAALSAAAFVHGGNAFLREYVGGAAPRDVVLVESFRTVKELLALIESHRPFGVSLWAHGAAEGDEVAFGVAAPLVWVNGHAAAAAAGPPRAALAYYCHTRPALSDDVPHVPELRALQKAWIARPAVERQQTLLRVAGGLRDSTRSKFYLKAVLLAASASKYNFVDVGDGELVVGVTRPRDVCAVEWGAVSERMAEVVRRLSRGGGFLVRAPAEGPDREFLARCEAQGLPVRLARPADPLLEDTLPPETTRVVHSTFGTIFAN